MTWIFASKAGLSADEMTARLCCFLVEKKRRAGDVHKIISFLWGPAHNFIILWTSRVFPMVYKLSQSSQKKWRKLRVFKLLADVVQGVQFRDGERIEKLDEAELSRNVA
jgi:hypothetical protein